MADTMKPCPLIFKPIFKPRIWGGRKIHTRFDKPLPPGENFGESWELADLEDDQSVVASGPQQGRTLRELVVEWGDQLLGGIALFEGRFPLLIKYLDAREHLSVQVHPDAKLAAQLGGAVRVKNEAWVVIDAEPDGCIYRGLVDSVTPDQFSKALSDGGVEKLLKRIPVRPGDAYYLPSGTVHALGPGIVLAEVQEQSNLTFRLFDWGRLGTDGKPRPIHIEESIQCTRFDRGPVHCVRPAQLCDQDHRFEELVRCDHFVIRRHRAVDAWHLRTDGRFRILIGMSGSGEVCTEQSTIDLQTGRTVLIPANCPELTIHPAAEMTLLEIMCP